MYPTPPLDNPVVHKYSHQSNHRSIGPRQHKQSKQTLATIGANANSMVAQTRLKGNDGTERSSDVAQLRPARLPVLPTHYT